MGYEVKAIRATASVMLTLNGELVDAEFFNKLSYEMGDISLTEIRRMAENLAEVNNVKAYTVNLTEVM